MTWVHFQVVPDRAERAKEYERVKSKEWWVAC